MLLCELNGTHEHILQGQHWVCAGKTRGHVWYPQGFRVLTCLTIQLIRTDAHNGILIKG
jgi:hypothetical protein